MDGHTFDSKLEADRYCELKLLQRAGKIKALQLQPAYELQPAFQKGGRKYRAIVYRADFAYWDVTKQRVVVEDTKGFQTEAYKLKKKLFEFEYPDLEIVEVTRNGKA